MKIDLIIVYNCLQGQFNFPDDIGRGTAHYVVAAKGALALVWTKK